MESEPGDFAAPGAEPACQALIRQILSNTHTMHYGAELYPFVQVIPELEDVDVSWALKQENRRDTDDGLENVNDEHAEALNVAAAVSIAVTPEREDAPSIADRTPTVSTPVPTSAGLPSATKNRSGTHLDLPSQPIPTLPSKPLRGPDAPPGAKCNMKELMKASAAIVNLEANRIAEEITRIEAPLFLAVEVSLTYIVAGVVAENVSFSLVNGCAIV